MLVRAVVTLVANAIGLLVADWLIDDFSVTAGSFILAVVIFTVALVVLGPLITSTIQSHAEFLMGGVALVTTFVGLLITSLLTDGLSISGTSAWIFGALIVWIASALAQIGLPSLLARLGVTETPRSSAA
jgi:uncharacterized membrane protein YvlD (DUF360 family)